MTLEYFCTCIMKKHKHMRKITFLMVWMSLLAFTAGAQNKLGSVKGKVVEKGQPVHKATVSLLSAADSVMVKVSVTNTSGEYEMEGIKAGKYLLLVTHTSFDNSFSPVFTLNEGQEYNADPISVTPWAVSGATATVRAKKPMIEVRADKTVFNIENSINAIGTNAFELLRKSPGVVVDKDDNISLKGKNGVRIFIDGKPSPFDAKDLAAFLKSINSADIESIEMITNPSAKYEAEGNAGIINIKLKKSKRLGYNGSVNLGFAQGITPKLNSSLTMNYRKNKWNVFGNYSNNIGENQFRFKLYREQLDSIYDQTNIGINDDKTHNFKVGADFFADKNNTFGVTVTGNFTNGDFISRSESPIYHKPTGVKGSTLYASNNLQGTRKNANYNFNYRYTDTTGVEAGIDIDHGRFNNNGDSYQPNEYRYVADLLNPVYKIYHNITPTEITINSFKADFGVPWKKGKLEFGGKYADVKTDNESKFYNVINGKDIKDINLSNRFEYEEKISALYLNYNRPLNEKWTIQAGVRMEHTESEGNLLSEIPQSDANVKRSYTNFFPSGAISYMANMNHMFNLTYSRRIDRPGYQDLNPFEYRLDELTFQKGNAFLRPQYTNSFEFTHTLKYRYNTTLGYSHIADYSAQLIDTANKNKSFITQKNLASQDIYSINFSAPVQVASWWSLFGNINVNHSLYKANFPDGKTINAEVTSGSFFAQNTFSLKGGYNIELSGFYQLPTIWGGTFESNGIGGMDVGVSAPLFNNQATVKFSYTDLLRTMRFRGVSNFGAAYIDASGRWESQQFKMNFTWRFGNKQQRAAAEKKAGNAEEQQRAKKGGQGGFGVGGGGN
jgi:iron complex outermembrane recepter protein